MNELIKELKEQAIRWSGENINRNLYSNYEIERKEYEKFAQLIISAVITELEIAKKCDRYTGELMECEKNTILTEQIEWLQEHFGVK